jgi:Lipase (class 3)
MEPDVVRLMRELCPQGSLIDRVLFTGHSLGGAIAQLFYLSSSTEGSLMHTATSGKKSIKVPRQIDFR